MFSTAVLESNSGHYKNPPQKRGERAERGDTDYPEMLLTNEQDNTLTTVPEEMDVRVQNLPLTVTLNI